MVSINSNSLSDILYLLIFDYKYRKDFCEEKFDKLGLTERDIYLLSTIDREELSSMSNKIIKDLLYMDSGYGGELYYSFPTIFKHLEKPELIIKDFLRSEHFKKYHVLLYDGPGLTLQEAFYNFLSSYDLYSFDCAQEIIKHDFLSSLFKLLVANKNPSFQVASREVEFRDNLIYSIQRYSKKFLKTIGISTFNSSFLYCVVNTRLVLGPISSKIGDVIKEGKGYSYSLDDPRDLALFNKLFALGIIK